MLLMAALCMLPSASLVGKNRKDGQQSQVDFHYFNILYLESVCQREKGNIAAQYELLQRALILKPDAPEALFDLATAAARSTMMTDSAVALVYEKAIDGVEKNMKNLKSPSDSAAVADQLTAYTETFARYQMARGKVAEAIPLWRKLAKNSVKRQEAYQMLVSAYSRMESPDDVLQTLNEWETMEGESSQVSVMKIQTFNRLHRYDDAIHVADSLAKTDPRNDYYAVAGAESYLLKGDTATAMRLYEQLKKQFPQSSSVDLLLVHYYQATNNQREMLKALEMVILNPETDADLKYSMMQSVVSTLKGTSEEGRISTLFRQLMDEQLESTELPELYARYLASKNAPDSAYVPAMQKIAELEPDNKQARLVLVQEALNRHDYQGAVERCVEALRYLPAELTFYHIAGGALYQENKIKESLAMFRRGMALVGTYKDKETVSNFLCSYADALHRGGERREAYACYDSALVYNPSNVICLNNYAYFLSLSKERLDEARRMSEKVMKLEPDNPTYIDTYAWILFVQKDYKDACTYMEKAMGLLKDTAGEGSLFEHAGDIYWHLGEKDKALQFWRKALKAGDGGAILKKKIKMQKYYPDETL